VKPWQFSGKRLTGHREARKISRTALAATIGKATDTLRFYEYNKNVPSVDTLAILAAYFYVTPNELFARPGNSDAEEYAEGFDAQTKILAALNRESGRVPRLGVRR
jgi:transcriptional regulator with XRE-family HTH domain